MTVPGRREPVFFVRIDPDLPEDELLALAGWLADRLIDATQQAEGPTDDRA